MIIYAVRYSLQPRSADPSLLLPAWSPTTTSSKNHPPSRIPDISNTYHWRLVLTYAFPKNPATTRSLEPHPPHQYSSSSSSSPFRPLTSNLSASLRPRIFGNWKRIWKVIWALMEKCSNLINLTYLHYWEHPRKYLRTTSIENSSVTQTCSYHPRITITTVGNTRIQNLLKT